MADTKCPKCGGEARRVNPEAMRAIAGPGLILMGIVLGIIGIGNTTRNGSPTIATLVVVGICSVFAFLGIMALAERPKWICKKCRHKWKTERRA